MFYLYGLRYDARLQLKVAKTHYKCEV